jgi:branched-chain amino acid aminotransferase
MGEDGEIDEKTEDGETDEKTEDDSGAPNLQFFVDGELVPAAEATVSVRDRGFMYGDAAFETMRSYGGTVFRWDAHWDRLEATCETLSIPLPGSRADLYERVSETLAANDLREASVRLSITRGADHRGLTPPDDPDPTVVIQVSPLPRGGVEGDSAWDDPEVLQTVKRKRVPDESIPSDAKTHNYLNGILARLETRVSDADEALVLDADGNVAEAATANVWFVDDNALRTPSLDGPILPGVTRDVVLDLAAEEGIPVEEETYAPDDVRDADEAFLTSSIREIRPIERLDGVEIGGGPVTSLLARLYDARVERECYESVEDQASGP